MDRRLLFGLAGGGLALAATSRSAAASTGFHTRAVVEAAAKAVRDEYVDPGTAAKLADLLLANLARGDYAKIALPNALAKRMTEDLHTLVNDQHLSVQYDPPVPNPASAAEIAEDDLDDRFTGRGVQTVARLPGNIGLLRVTHFPSPPRRDRYAAAMEMLRDTNALVLDFTVNHGGGTDTAGYFLSYFLDPGILVSRGISRNEPVEIVTTTADVAGPRYGTEKPLFVAISGNTFSAGERISAALRAHKRATLVGRRTRGGAHFGNFVKLPDGFQIFVVKGRIEGGGIGDFEGVGIEPDIRVEQEFAVAACYRLALETLIGKERDAKTRQVLMNVRGHTIENLSSWAF